MPPAHTQQTRWDWKKTAEREDPDFPNIDVSAPGFDLDAYQLHSRRLLEAAHIPIPKIWLTWKDLKCSVPLLNANREENVFSPFIALYHSVRNGFAKVTKSAHEEGAAEQDALILDHVSGVLRPGEMCLVLGPAGCGGSLLLQRLAGRDVGKMVGASGDVLYNGKPILDDVARPSHFIKIVPQLDHHFAHLTVRQTLEFAARCKWPDFVPHVEALRANQVLLIARTLGIERVLDTPVGSDAMRGVSGGERRRVSIGEMAVGPSTSCVLMDNWSKGLDSATTLSITRSVRSLVDTLKATFVVTMQSPGTDAYNTFDKLTCLDSGKLIYFGPISEAEQWFVSLGFRRPPHRSVPDFISTITDSNFRNEYLDKSAVDRDVSPPRTVQEFADRFAASHWGRVLRADIEADAEAEHETPEFEPPPDLVRLVGTRNLQSSLQQFRALARREVSLLSARRKEFLRDIFVNVVFALLMGSMFWQLPLTREGASTRSGLLFLTMVYLGLSALSTIKDKHEMKVVFAKQRAASFYGAAPFIFTSAVIDLTITLVKTIFFILPLYLMAGLELGSSGQRVLYATMIVWLLQNIMSLMTRFLVAVCEASDGAQAVAGIVTITFITFAGFLRRGDELANYLSWVYWIDPLHYCFEALVINEYDGLEFNCLPEELLPANPAVPEEFRNCLVSSGTEFLAQSLGITEGPSYRLYYFLVMCGYLVLFLIVSSVATILVRPRGFAMTLKLESAVIADRAAVGDSVTVDVEAGKAAGAAFTFTNMSYSVNNGAKLLLDSVSGCAPPGLLVALIGTSGAGKTTLLDCVAGRKTLTGGASVSGEVCLNGRTVSSEELSFVSGYVEQSDMHIEEATVREAVRFSAVLRLPREMSASEKNVRVMKVLDKLNLTLHGNVLVKSLGAAELKLLTLALELVADPAVMFCDEPTSGLSTSSALQVVKALRTIADSGTAVICTIHQPSAEVFESFDRLLFLQRGGRTVYAGEVGHNGEAVRRYFESQGVPKAAVTANVSEWMLEAVGDESVDWHALWLESEMRKVHLAEVAHLAEPPAAGSSSSSSNVNTDFARASHGTQIKECLKRQFLRYFRLPEYNLTRVVTVLFMAVLFGLVFLRDAAPDVQTAITVATAALFLATIPSVLSVQNVAPPTFKARLPFTREIASGTYKSIAHDVSIGIVEVPYTFVTTTTFTVVFYFMVGLRPAQFGYFFLAIQLFYFFCVMLGVALSSISPSLELALIFASMVTTICNVLSGFLIRAPNMPVYWKWFRFVNPFFYFLSGCLQNEFMGRSFTCDQSSLGAFRRPDGISACSQIPGGAAYGDTFLPGNIAGCTFCPFPDGESVISLYGAGDVNKWISLVALVVGIVAMRMIAAFGFSRMRFVSR